MEVNIITQMFPEFKLPTPEDLRTMDSAAIQVLFNDLKSIQIKINDKVVQTRTQKEQLEKSITATLAEIKQEFGTDSMEDLEKILQDKLTEFEQVSQKLQAAISEPETN